MDSTTYSAARRNPLGILTEQNLTRVQELVPLRSERMSANPFAFYRGTAAIMAADQSRDPHSGILVASCGDAHVSNFGFYASPQRTLLFDLNDFDESAWAPWEWDLQRLVTSVIIGAKATERESEFVNQAATETVAAYVRALKAAARKSPVERYYSHFDPQANSKSLDKTSRKALKVAMRAARKRTGDRAARRMTEWTDAGKRRFIESAPVTVAVTPEIAARIQSDFDQYRLSANVDIRTLLSQYVVDDAARRVVGVGSVGTRCYIALLRDRTDDMLILQVKQAGHSVLEQYGGIEQPRELKEVITESGEGARVVGLQRILQAYSDPFLGHIQTPGGDFYVRQFHDMKGGIEVEQLKDISFLRYATACAQVLARAHAQSPNATEVMDYIGGDTDRISAEIVSWCQSYAELSLQDFREFVGSVS